MNAARTPWRVRAVCVARVIAGVQPATEPDPGNGGKPPSGAHKPVAGPGETV